MNMPKRGLHLLMLPELKFGYNAFIISTEHGERSPHVIGQYKECSKNFVMKMRALKMKKVENGHSVLITNN